MGEGESNMKVSQGEPCGRKVILYHPELFDEHEEVIIFMREEFSRTYEALIEHMDFITKRDIGLDRDEEWKLLGYWPEIMERAHIIGLDMNTIFGKKPIQSYLDTYLYIKSKSIGTELVVTNSKVPGKTIEPTCSK